MGIGFLILIAIVVYFIYMNSEKMGQNSIEGPMETLKKRYAKGEISREEYEQIKKDLT